MDHEISPDKCRAAAGKDAGAKMSLGEKMTAGAFSALPSTALMAPVERIKCLLQIQGEEVRPAVEPTVSGMTACI